MIIEKKTEVIIDLRKCLCGSRNLVIFELNRGLMYKTFKIVCKDCGKESERRQTLAECAAEWNDRNDNNWYPPKEAKQ